MVAQLFYEPEDLELRRFPRLTVAVIAVLALLQLFHTFTREKPVELAGAMNRWQQRPYLEADPRLVHLARNHSDMILVQLPERKPENLAVLSQQQAELDLLFVFAMQERGPFSFERWTFLTDSFSIIKLFTHFTYHESSWHLAIGLVFFYFAAPFLEDRWGRWLFAGFLLAAGVLTTLAVSYIFPRPGVYLYGFTGIAGATLGAYLWHFRNHPISIGLSFLSTERLGVPPLLVLGLWSGLAFFYAAVVWLFLPFTSILVWHHLWGLFIGAGTAWAIGALGFGGQTRAPKQKGQEAAMILSVVDDHLRQRRKREALTLLAEASRRFPEDREINERYWNQAVRMGQAYGASHAGINLVMSYLNKGREEEAYFHWCELIQHCPQAVLPADAMASMAQQLFQKKSKDQALHVMTFLADNLPGDADHDQLTGFADLAASMDPGLGYHWSSVLLARDDLPKPLKISLEAQANQLAIASREQSRQEENPGIEIALDEPLAPSLAEDPFAPTRIHALKIFPCLPHDLDDRGLSVEVAQKVRHIKWGQIKAFTLAAIREISSPPYVLVDLVLDSPLDELERHRVLRMKGKSFDPRILMKQIEHPAEATRALIKTLAEKTEAQALPDEETLLGKTFPSFSSLPDFEVQIYGVSSR